MKNIEKETKTADLDVLQEQPLLIEGRNAVLEAFRSGKPVDKLFVLDGCQDGPIRTIIREAKKHDVILNFVGKERLNQISGTGKHQGVIAFAAAYEYAQVEDMLALAKSRGEDPFLILLDPWGDYPQAPGIRAYGYGGENLCRGAELHSGGQGDQSGKDH